MEQPPGFVAQGECNLVCKLHRSLYGLKQSPRAWFGKFSTVILEFGMFRCDSDHTVFYRHNSQGKCIYLVVYVDDIVITGDDQDGIEKLKKHLFHHFQTKDLGLLKYFLVWCSTYQNFFSFRSTPRFVSHTTHLDPTLIPCHCFCRKTAMSHVSPWECIMTLMLHHIRNILIIRLNDTCETRLQKSCIKIRNLMLIPHK